MKPAAKLPYAELRAQLQRLIDAIDDGDEAGLSSGLEALSRQQGTQTLYGNVARITRELHDAMQSLKLDVTLNRIAGDEIPDARHRLDYVIKITENAAHQTLDLVERAGVVVGELDAMAVHMAQLGDENTVLSKQLAGHVKDLRATLTELSQAQAYQDLSGQIIGRIIKLVGSVEDALLELLRAGRPDLKSGEDLPINSPVIEDERSSLERSGPGARNAATQEDADDLLARLGF